MVPQSKVYCDTIIMKIIAFITLIWNVIFGLIFNTCHIIS